MALTPDALDPDALRLLDEPHLATLTTTMPDGRLHVVPVAYTYVHEERTVRIVAPASSVKTRNARRGDEGALCFVDGGLWMSLHGATAVRTEPDRVADTLARYTQRYGPPHGPMTDAVSLEIAVEVVRGRWSFSGR